MDITALAQVWVETFLREGDLAIDATIGNGHDTAFLARRVGASGKVIGFDVQEIALEAAKELLEREGLLERTRLVRRSHAEMAAVVTEADRRRGAKGIMFNLGYLPGGDKTVTTQTAETMQGLEAALGLLAPGGILTVVLYPGHPEGKRELDAVMPWAQKLRPPFLSTLSHPLNRAGTAPCLIAVEKSGGQGV